MDFRLARRARADAAGRVLFTTRIRPFLVAFESQAHPLTACCQINKIPQSWHPGLRMGLVLCTLWTVRRVGRGRRIV